MVTVSVFAQTTPFTLWSIVLLVLLVLCPFVLVSGLGYVIQRWCSVSMWFLLAGILGASGVGLGAYAAHGLGDALERRELEKSEIETRVQNCETAVRYQLILTVAILAMGIATLSLRRKSWPISLATSAFVLGVVGFSGGLYCSALELAKLHWVIIPAGGLLMIAAWLILAAGAIFFRTDDDTSKPAQ